MTHNPIGRGVLLLLALASVGCEIQSFDLGRRAAAPVIVEACDNGMDDDADGQIDEGCFCGGGQVQRCFGGVYPNRLVGACRDGRQLCSTDVSGEFGHWLACSGDALPASEVCTEAETSPEDENCDGAVDEGCVCVASLRRPCGFGAAVGVCVSGEQRCLDEGIWSGCIGAIGPGPERCDDALDNDCDGRLNEGCDCVPAPEACGDGLDNDCDERIDEGCGALRCEAGSCPACACERWTSIIRPLELSGNGRGGTRNRAVEVAFDGQDLLGFLYGNQDSLGGHEVHFELQTLGGTILADETLAMIPDIPPPAVFAPTQDGITGLVAYGSHRFVVTWAQGLLQPGLGTVYGAVFNRSGEGVAGPLVLADNSAYMGGVAIIGEQVHLVFSRSGLTYAQTFDLALSPLDAPLEIPGITIQRSFATAQFGIEVAAVDDSLVIVGSGTPGTTMRVATVRDGALIDVSDLGLLTEMERDQHRASVASEGSGTAMVCYQLDGGSISCRRFAPIDGQLLGAAFEVAPDGSSRAWDLVAAGCAYQLVLGVSEGSGPQSSYRTYEIDADNNVMEAPLDHHWSQSNQSFAAFETLEGELLRVMETTFIALSTCAPALPEPDCQRLLDDGHAAACGGCDGDPSTCSVTFAGYGSGTSPERYVAFDCATIDTVACRIALDAPQDCSGLRWHIPADCQLPK